MLILHILLALSGLTYSFYTIFFPTQVKIKIIYAIAAMTLISGGILSWSTGVPLQNACISGAFYLAAIIFLVSMAKRKLLTINSNMD